MVTRYRQRSTIRDNLIGLYQENLEERFADNLGLSSLSRGSGFIEFHDGGTVIAQLGDLPSGGFGVGVRQAGQIVDAAGVFTQHDQRITATHGEVTGARGNSDTLGQRLSAIDQEVYNTDQRARNARIVADDARDEVRGARGGFGTLNGRLNDHATRVGGAENAINGLGSRVGDAEGRLDSHAGRIGSVESTNSSQNTRLGSLEDGRQAHAQRLGALENNYANLKSRVDQIYNWLLENSTFPNPGGIIPP